MRSGVGVLYALKTPPRNGHGSRGRLYTGLVGDWHAIGTTLGLGIAFGVLFAGLLSATPVGRIAAVVLGGAAGASAGALSAGWIGLGAGAVAGVVGGAAAVVIVSGALRRGGTRGGIAVIVGVAAIGLAALAFVPIVGYLEAIGLPALAARLRRTRAEQYAGLRSLAKD